MLLPILFLVGMVAVSRTSKTELMPARNFVDNFTDFAEAGFEPTPVKPYVCLKLTADAYAVSPVASVFPRCADGATVYELGTDPEGGPTAIEFDGFATTRDPTAFVYSYLGKFEQARLVTDLDEAILVRYVARRILSWTIRTQWWESPAALANLGRIYVSPPGAAADALVAQLTAASPLFEHVFGGVMAEDDAIAYARDDNTAANVWGIIVLDQFDASGMNVKLRFNQTVLPFSSTVRSRFGDSNGLGTHRTELWMASGFSTFQTLVSDAYLSVYFGGSTAGTNRQALAPMSYAAYLKNDFLTGAGGLLPLAIVLGFLYPVSQLTRLLVEEKELRVREAMMIMGLGNFAFYLSWLIPYIGMHLIISVIITIIVKATFLEHSNGGIIFFLFFFFGLSCIGLSVLLSSFFSKARVAALVSPVVFFLLAIPSFALSDDAPANTKRGLLILGPSAFSFGSKLLFDYELVGGMHGRDMNNKMDDVPMILALVMLVIDTAIYLLLGFYFEAVLPSDWGVPTHPLLCLGPAITRMRNALCGRGQRRLKLGTSVINAEGIRDGRDQNGAFESRSDGARPTVRLLGMRKDFETPSGTIRAVNDLTLDLYENDISVLLGHNGAGKTTAISLITGMLPMTEGDCTVYGASVRNDLAAVRQRIGYCPQHNILWPELTCREHLRFYCALKGLTGNAAEKQINILLSSVDLTDKADAFSAGLSGGQKRKLSVAISFCGGAKLIFLDEPTAGMDVAARRFTWDLVRRMSAGRTIVLTTHFMDEADLLGHTINIMSQGRLKCQGSSTFLKTRLGVGYTLSVVMAPGFQSAASAQNIVRLAASYVSESSPLHGSAAEVRVRLPTQQVAHFAPLLAALETRSAEFGVSGFGISVTTLEEVFMRIADESEHHEEDSETPVALVPMGASAPSADSEPISVDGAAPAKTATDSALLTTTASTPGTGSVAVSIDSAPASTTVPPPAGNSSRAATQSVEPFDARELYHPDELARSDVPFRVQLRVLMTKRFHTGRRDKRTIVLQIIVPIICLILAMLLANIKYPSQPALNLAPSSYGGPVEFATSSDCGATFGSSVPTSNRMVSSGRAGAGGLSEYLLQTFYGHADERVASFACPSAAATSPVVPVVFSNESFPSGGAYALAQYNILHIREVADVPVEMYHYPMPLSNSAQATVDSLTAVIVGIMILVPFTFIPSIYAAFIVKEREVHAKHLQQVSGMQFLPYWVSNFIFDFVSFLITDILALIVFAIFNRKEYIGSGDAVGGTIMLLLMYTLSSIMMAYAISFLFASHATAQNVIMMTNFVAGFILVLMVFILGFIDSTKGAADPLRYVLRLIPAFSLGDGLIRLATLQSYRRSIPDAPSAFDVDWIGLNLLYMGLLTPAFALLTLFLDHPNGSASISRWFRHTCGSGSDDNVPAAATAASPVQDEDVDVQRERKEVESGERDRDLVVVKKLHKRFGEKVAVRDLSFGIHHGEVFAFLGTNGAGKTTTISILCGELTPTSGSGWIAGKNVESDMADVRQQIGYCPQFDALLELLTVEEHLYLISGLRGIPAGPVQDRVVQRLIRMCDLTRHCKKTAGSLSGGNKRKLSVAIALIGAPKVVFLDEPSAGMDPMARHGMWDVIENLSKACCVVLTTHHLEEVEALADRVAIMVAGSLRCVGSLQHLKTKFGSGFELTMRLESESHVPAVTQFITSTIPAATLQEERLGKITYALPPDAKLSAVFASVEQHKSDLHILDYTVSQTSLEQVFLRIGADAFHEEEE